MADFQSVLAKHSYKAIIHKEKKINHPIIKNVTNNCSDNQLFNAKFTETTPLAHTVRCVSVPYNIVNLSHSSINDITLNFAQELIPFVFKYIIIGELPLVHINGNICWFYEMVLSRFQ